MSVPRVAVLPYCGVCGVVLAWYLAWYPVPELVTRYLN